MPAPGELSVFTEGALTEPRLSHPEGVAVDADGFVWCGGELGQIYRIAPDGSSRELVASTGGFSLGMAFDASGDLYVCDQKYAVVFRLRRGAREPELFSDGTPGHRFRIPNYPAFGPDGALYVSDSWDMAGTGPGIVRITPDGRGSLWHSGPFTFANGLAFNRAGDRLYVAETFRHVVSAVAVQPDGSAGEIRDVLTLPGLYPDGLAVAEDGSVFVGCYEPSVVVRGTEDGEWSVFASDPSAHLLAHPTNLAFSGDDLISANLGRWHLTRIHAGVRGLPLPPTAG